MVIRIFLITGIFSLIFLQNIIAQPVSLQREDEVADNMLLYQRSVGGWPRHIGEEKIDYTKKLSPAEKAGVIDDFKRNDAIIDISKKIVYDLIPIYIKKYFNNC